MHSAALRAFALSSVVLALACAAARADTVRLHNGDRFTGEIVEISAGKVVISTQWGKVVIDQKEVAFLSMEKPAEISLEDGGSGEAAIVTTPEGRFPFGGKVVPLSSVISLKQPYRTPDELERWSGEAGLAVSASDGNSRTMNAHADFSIVRDQSHALESLRNKVSAFGRYDYGLSGGRQTQRSGLGAARLDLFLYEGAGLYVEGAAGFDVNAGVDLRLAVSAGARAEHVLGGFAGYLGLGISFVSITYDETPSRRESDPYLRIEAGIKGKLPMGFDFAVNAEVLPNLSDSSRFLATVTASAARELSGGWYLKFAVSYDYNSHPAAGRLRGDALYYAALAFKF